jgi:biofilm protein TabA
MYLSAQTSPEWTSGNAKKWMKSAVWSNGWTVSPHKSVNAVEFACQYHKNKDVWDAAFRFLAEHDLEALSIGNHVILEGKCWATVSEYIPKEVEKGSLYDERSTPSSAQKPAGYSHTSRSFAGRPAGRWKKN